MNITEKNGKNILRISKSDWNNIGKKAGWTKLSVEQPPWTNINPNETKEQRDVRKQHGLDNPQPNNVNVVKDVGNLLAEAKELLVKASELSGNNPQAAALQNNLKVMIEYLNNVGKLFS